MREPRSIIFYAWAGLAVQSALTAAVITFVLAGAAYQRDAIEQLRGKVQAIQVANLAMVADFLDAQRTVAGYQATGTSGLLADYRHERASFGRSLGQLHGLAPPSVGRYVSAEQSAALSASGSSGIARSSILYVIGGPRVRILLSPAASPSRT